MAEQELLGVPATGTSAPDTHSLKADRIQPLINPSVEYSDFESTVALYNFDASDPAEGAKSNIVTNKNSRSKIYSAWRIDRQTPKTEKGINYNLLAVQAGDNKGQYTFASVLVPTVYNTGATWVRKAFVKSQTPAERRTLTVKPGGGYAKTWADFDKTKSIPKSIAPPQSNPPAGHADDRKSNYAHSLQWDASA